MSSYKYSPVGLPTSPTKASHRNHVSDDKRALSRLLLVAPLYHFLMEPLLRVLPAAAISILVKLATLWRRGMSYRPLRAVPLLNDISMAHVLLCIPLLWWMIQASDLALLRPTSHHSLKHSGKMASYAMAFAFFTANKSHSFVSLVTGLSFERLMNFHLASALLTLWMSLLHGIQIAYWNRGDKHHKDKHHDHHKSHDSHDDHHHHHHSDDHDDGHHHHHRRLHHDSIHAYLGPDPNLWEFFWDGQRNSSGTVVLVALLVLVVTSVFHGVLRKWWFEGWLVPHIAAAIVVLVAGMIHGADAFWFVILWWGLDLLIRYGLMVGFRYPRTAMATRVAENVTKLHLDKSDLFHYEAGQFVQVAIPSLQLMEFHPFSIASIPEDPHVTIYVRALPDHKTWTRKLYNLAAAPCEEDKKQNDNQLQRVRVFLEGPYGSVAPIVERPEAYSMAVLISGGIGVTPCLSIAKQLVANANSPASSLQKIRYIWSIRDENMIQAIPPPKLLENIDGTRTAQDGDDNGIELVERGQGDQSAGEPSGDTDRRDNGDALATGESRRPLILQNDIYVTQGAKFADDDDHQSEDNDDDNTNEESSTTIHRGKRPDVPEIMSQIAAEAQREGWGRVFVMGCGPISLLEELEVACRGNQSNDVQIDFHQEIFDY